MHDQSNGVLAGRDRNEQHLCSHVGEQPFCLLSGVVAVNPAVGGRFIDVILVGTGVLRLTETVPFPAWTLRCERVKAPSAF